LSTITNIGHSQTDIEAKIREIISFYTTRKDTVRKFTKLIVLGNSHFDFSNLAKSLGIRIDVPKLNHLLDKKNSKLVNEYIPNLGLYTKIDLGVNILPPEQKIIINKRQSFLKISEALNSALIIIFITFYCAVIFLVWININRTKTEGIIASKSKIQISPKLSAVRGNVNELNTKLSTINTLDGKTNIGYNTLVSIVNDLPAKADINEIKYDNILKTLEIDGTISNREDLISYQNSLNKIPEISSVDLPLKNFEQDTNIPFEIDIKIK
jgi:hypothetical protein